MRRHSGDGRGLHVVFFVALSLFVALAAAIAAGVPVPGDRTIYLFLSRYEETRLGSAVGFFAGRVIEVVGVAAVAAIFATLVVAGRISAAALLAASFFPLVLKPVLQFAPLLRGVFERQQPPLVHPSVNWSFPSGHAIGSTAVAAVAVAAAWPTRWRKLILLAACFFVAAVGIAAVIKGGHWPSDVLAGWSFVLAWVSALYWLAPEKLGGIGTRRKTLEEALEDT